MAKRKTIIVKLESESGYFYTTRKNPKMAHKLELKKFDPITRRHTVFKEKKIK